jgi:hypothetical protein
LSVPRAISAYLITRWRAVRKSVMALSVCALPMRWRAMTAACTTLGTVMPAGYSGALS